MLLCFLLDIYKNCWSWDKCIVVSLVFLLKFLGIVKWCLSFLNLLLLYFVIFIVFDNLCMI